jgi:hypothetical protein
MIGLTKSDISYLINLLEYEKDHYEGEVNRCTVRLSYETKIKGITKLLKESEKAFKKADKLQQKLKGY